MTPQAEAKRLVGELVDRVNRRDARGVAELVSGRFAEHVRNWVEPFQGSFPDFRMEVVELIAEGDRVVAHLRCSGTHLNPWLGRPPTGRRFVDVDEIYVFTVRDGRLVAATGVEDNLSRMRQLGFLDPGATSTAA